MPLTSITSSKRNRLNKVNRVIDNMVNSIDSRIAGKDPASTIKIYDSYNVPYGTVGSRNSNFWCSSLSAITCISPWNSYEGYARAGTLIAPDMVVFSNHFPILSGNSIDFYTMGGSVVTRTIIAQRRIQTTDLMLGKLDSDVPNTIAYAKVLPKTFYPLFSEVLNNGSVKVPIMSLDQQEHASVTDTYVQSQNSFFSIPTDSTRLSFYEGTYEYDSGNPSLWVYNNDLIIISVWFGGGLGSPGSGPSFHYYRDDINSTMTALSSPYQLTEVVVQ